MSHNLQNQLCHFCSKSRSELTFENVLPNCRHVQELLLMRQQERSNVTLVGNMRICLARKNLHELKRQGREFLHERCALHIQRTQVRLDECNRSKEEGFRLVQ